MWRQPYVGRSTAPALASWAKVHARMLGWIAVSSQHLSPSPKKPQENNVVNVFVSGGCLPLTAHSQMENMENIGRKSQCRLRPGTVK